MNCHDNTIQPGDTVGFIFLGVEYRGIVESVYTCAADGRPTDFEPDETRYFVLPIVNGVVQPGHMLVLPADCPCLLHKHTAEHRDGPELQTLDFVI